MIKNKRTLVITAIVLSLTFNCLLLTGSIDAQNRASGAKSKRAAKSVKGASRKRQNRRNNRARDEKTKVIRLDSQSDRSTTGPFSRQADAFGITPPIRDLPAVRDGLPFRDVTKVKGERDEGIIIRTEPTRIAEATEDLLAKRSRDAADLFAPQTMPLPALTFNGILGSEAASVLGFSSMPPDTVGDVGPAHYVQATNSGVFRVFDKTGTASTAVAAITNLFSGLPPASPCRTLNDGDPVVNYDPLADRWLVSQFAVGGATDGQCIAVSVTGDPTGAWYAYFFQQPNSNFPDYPHWSVWTNGYYLATHDFNAALTAYVEGSFWAFDRAKMLVGDPTAGYIRFGRAASYGHLPADIDGYMPPAAATPAMFFEFGADENGYPSDRLLSYDFAPDFAIPANSTLTVKPHVNTAAFDPRDQSDFTFTSNSIEQPAPATAAQALDAGSGKAMFRVGYRNLGTLAAPINSYVMNLTVNVSGTVPLTISDHQAGIRWTEVRRDGAGAISIFDEGTHAPDPTSGTGRNRWMGSIAQDNLGNLALGFSRSGSGAGEFPDIVWAGRTGGIVAAGTMNEGEELMFASTGVQQHTNARWGDYSQMSVDPIDDCTFWFTSEWRDSAFNGGGINRFRWSTRIGNFKFPGCTAQPKGQIAANITNCVGGAPISGATVAATAGNFSRLTNTAGNLISDIVAAPNLYTVTASKPGFIPASIGATVTNGNTTVVNLCLNGPTAATVSVSGRVVTGSGRATTATVAFTDSAGETFSAMTTPNGRFFMEGLRAGETYIVTVSAKRFRFAAQVLTLNDNLTGVVFTATP